MAKVHSPLQILGFLLLVAAFSGILSTMVYDSGKHWRDLLMTGESVEVIGKYEGLFLRCSMYPTGQEECSSLDPANLPEFTILARVMMFISALSLAVAIFCSFVGSAWSSCLYKTKNSDQIKAKLVVISGFLSIFVGVLCIVTGACYTLGVSTARSADYIKNQNQREIGGNVGFYETGSAVNTLWIVLVLCVLNTGCAILSSWKVAMKKQNAMDRVVDYMTGEEFVENDYRRDGGYEYSNNPTQYNRNSAKKEKIPLQNDMDDYV